ncbi:MAG: shikimate kinase, partial [Dorea sp.]
MDQLTKLREQLEMCDKIVLDALKMRYQIVENITVFKQEHGLDIVHLDEDERKKHVAEEVLKDDKYKETILDVYEYIRHRSKKIQSMNLFDHNIFLIGFMGAGKSTISSALQKIFAMEVIEMDQLISQRNGMSISEIFETYGEQYFRN